MLFSFIMKRTNLLLKLTLVTFYTTYLKVFFSRCTPLRWPTFLHSSWEAESASFFLLLWSTRIFMSTQWSLSCLKDVMNKRERESLGSFHFLLVRRQCSPLDSVTWGSQGQSSSNPLHSSNPILLQEKKVLLLPLLLPQVIFPPCEWSDLIFDEKGLLKLNPLMHENTHWTQSKPLLYYDLLYYSSSTQKVYILCQLPFVLNSLFARVIPNECSWLLSML